MTGCQRRRQKTTLRAEGSPAFPVYGFRKIMHGDLLEKGSALETLSDLLRRRARQFPNRTAFVYEDETGQRVEWTYAQLDRRAVAIAAWLMERAAVGDRALLVYPPGLEFIAAFFGCLYAGVLPVPATYPKPRRPLPRLDTIAADCAPCVVLTHSSVLGGLRLEQQSPAVAELPWEATDSWDVTPGENFQPVVRVGDDLAFLQYTSGSTSDPRGVMISHKNLLHNLERIRQGCEIPFVESGDEVLATVFWLPAYHDMGLIGGILMPIYAGGIAYLLAPTSFLRRPLRWLELLSETGAQFSGAPNFGYELLVQKTTAEERAALDLSQWRLAFCGAEPIHSGTLHAFANAFAPAGFCTNSFYPCYGMAEVTLLVTGGLGSGTLRELTIDRERLRQHQAVRVEKSHEQAQTLVGCGSTFHGQQLEIVDPQSLVVCQAGRVGEIWVRGRSVARGYWNQEAVNQEVFQAQLAGSNGEPFLRTGDLGFCLEGELYITGRIKDLLIIRGRNHYPQDIERTAVEADAAVGLGAAFAVELDRQEALVVVHQINREHRQADFQAVIRAIRTAVTQEHELDPQAIVLIKPASLPITSSGKVQRQRCREQYLADALKVVARWSAKPTAVGLATTPTPGFLAGLLDANPQQLQAEIEAWLVDWLTVRAGLSRDAIRSSTLFAELGIDSLTAMEISLELDQLLELQLSPMAIWSNPTCAALAEFLVTELIANRKGEKNGEQPA